ncbi:MAG TPA: allantoate amidohydrolase [Pirellulales bacterium]|nr:allantoate amidohydrolase [Pirellulales bacterium]
MTNHAATPATDARGSQFVAEAARQVMRRCDQLADCTDRPGEVCRLFCSPAMQSAHTLVRSWIEATGMSCRLDAAGNLIGRLDPPKAGDHRAVQNEQAAALIIGSHLDTVVNGGKYDGALGVLLGLALAEIAVKTDTALPFPLVVIGFCEEEGVRYQEPYFGSRALVGDIPDAWLRRPDAEGVPLADALRTFRGDPDRLAECVLRPEDVLALVEPHIEQGPTLEDRSLPLGVVTGAVGHSRASLEFVGRAGHAGTVPMQSRRDALCAAAQFIVELEQLAAGVAGLVATVGRVEVLPNVANVIPGEVRLRLDLRHAEDRDRLAAFRKAIERAGEIARQRGLEFNLLWEQQQESVQFDAACSGRLEQAIVAAGLTPGRLSSGAGHDAVILARHFPTAMLFLRCAGGISHHPDEAVSEADVATALEVLWRFVTDLAASTAPDGVQVARTKI